MKLNFTKLFVIPLLLFISCNQITIKGDSKNCMFFELVKVNQPNQRHAITAVNGKIDKSFSDLQNGFYFLKNKKESKLVYLNKGQEVVFNVKNRIKFEDEINKYLSEFYFNINNNFKNTLDFYNKLKEGLNNISCDEFKQKQEYYINCLENLKNLEAQIVNNASNDKIKKALNKIDLNKADFTDFYQANSWLNLIFKAQTIVAGKKVAFKEQLDFLKNDAVKQFWAYRKIRCSKIDENTYDNAKLAFSIIKNSYYKGVVERVMVNSKKYRKGNAGFDFRYADNKGKLTNFSSLLGKQIYLMIWRTDVKESVKALKEFYKLEKKYKDIRFVSVCLNRDVPKWKEILKANKANNIAFITSNESQFLKYYNLKSMPHYMLFDNKAKIVSVNAKSPFSDELINSFKNK